MTDTDQDEYESDDTQLKWQWRTLHPRLYILDSFIDWTLCAIIIFFLAQCSCHGCVLK